jgi:hypothetical protein
VEQRILKIALKTGLAGKKVFSSDCERRWGSIAAILSDKGLQSSIFTGNKETPLFDICQSVQ